MKNSSFHGCGLSKTGHVPHSSGFHCVYINKVHESIVISVIWNSIEGNLFYWYTKPPFKSSSWHSYKDILSEY